jgi:hypothetical protein
MSLILQKEHVPLGDTGLTGYFHVFETDYTVLTSLADENKEGTLFMFTVSDNSFLFHIDILQDYTSHKSDFFSSYENDALITCTFCGGQNNYSIVRFHEFAEPDIKNEVEGDSLNTMLHSDQRKPLCSNCILNVFEATINQINSETELYASKLI